MRIHIALVIFGLVLATMVSSNPVRDRKDDDDDDDNDVRTTERPSSSDGSSNDTAQAAQASGEDHKASEGEEKKGAEVKAEAHSVPESAGRNVGDVAHKERDAAEAAELSAEVEKSKQASEAQAVQASEVSADKLKVITEALEKAECVEPRGQLKTLLIKHKAAEGNGAEAIEKPEPAETVELAKEARERIHTLMIERKAAVAAQGQARAELKQKANDLIHEILIQRKAALVNGAGAEKQETAQLTADTREQIETLLIQQNAAQIIGAEAVQVLRKAIEVREPIAVAEKLTLVGQASEVTGVAHGSVIHPYQPFPHTDLVFFELDAGTRVLPGPPFKHVLSTGKCEHVILGEEVGGRFPVNQTICDTIAKMECSPLVANVTCSKPPGAGQVPQGIQTAEVIGNAGYPYGGPLCHVKVNGLKVQPSVSGGIYFTHPKIQTCVFQVAQVHASTEVTEVVVETSPVSQELIQLH